MCGRYYIPEEDSAEELRAIIDEVNRKNNGAPIKKARSGRLMSLLFSPIIDL